MRVSWSAVVAFSFWLALTSGLPSKAASATESRQEDKCITFADFSGPNILGIYLGMSLQTAMYAATCERTGLSVEEMGNAPGIEPFPDGSAPTTSILFRGQGEQIALEFAGLPNSVALVGVERRQEFPVGQQPTVTTVRAALQEKYGSLEAVYRGDDTVFARLSAFAGEATVITPLQMCFHNTNWGRFRIQFRDYCGLLVGARITRSRSNPDLVSRLVVAITDGQSASKLWREYNVARAEAVRQKQIQGTRGARKVKVKL